MEKPSSFTNPADLNWKQDEQSWTGRRSTERSNLCWIWMVGDNFNPGAAAIKWARSLEQSWILTEEFFSSILRSTSSFLIVTFWREETDPSSRLFFQFMTFFSVFLQFAFFAKAAADQSRLQCDVVLSSLVVRYPKEIKSKQNMTFSRNTPILCNGKIACEQRLCC